MGDFGWLFGWAKDNDIEIPIAYDGRVDIQKLLELYNESKKSGKSKELNDKRNPLEKAYGFVDKKKKNSPDHIQHAREMGFKNQDDYERAAIDYWNKGEGEIFYGTKRGRYAKYNEKTSEYVVVDKDGTLRTYYKIPSNRFKKIKKQEGLEEWKK